MLKIISFFLLFVFTNNIFAQELEIKTSATLSYEPGFFFKKPKSDDMDKALKEIRKNVWLSYTSTFSDAKMKQYLKVKEQIDPEIDNFITSLSVVDVNVKSELKTFTVYARAKINDTAVNARLSFLSKAGQTATGNGSPFTFLFIAKQAEKVLDFKDLDNSYEYSERRSADYSFKAYNPSFIDTAVTNILSTAGFEVISYSDLIIQCNAPDLKTISENLLKNDSMTADVRKKVIESAKKCDIDFLAIAILDIGIKSKIASNQNREINVSVQGQVWDIQKKLPRVIASIGPITSGVNEKDDLTAIKKALQTPSEEVAKGLVDQLNAKNIN